MELRRKLEILADAAKYDASCASSGTDKRDSRAGGIGSTEGMGICHAYAPDGRCISLLKVLLTNACVFDCAYCINRATSNVAARPLHGARSWCSSRSTSTGATTSRGCSSPPASSARPDYTMEQIVGVARLLREEHGFRGYIHLKTIPDADPGAAGRGRALRRPPLDQRRAAGGRHACARWRRRRTSPASAGRWGGCGCGSTRRRRRSGTERPRRARRASPRPGSRTQMIVGADASDDRAVLGTTSNLYASYGMRRVYFSAYSPIPDASRAAAAGGAAAGAGAPALPGGLAAALLRLRAGGDPQRRRRRDARPRDRPEAGLGAAAPGRLPGGREPGRRGSGCCACPGSGPRRWTG